MHYTPASSSCGVLSQDGVKNVGDLVHPATLLAGLGVHLALRGPEARRAVADSHHRCTHPAALEAAQDLGPRLLGLAVPVADRDEFLAPVSANPDQNQAAEAVLLEPDVEVHPVGPHVHVVD